MPTYLTLLRYTEQGISTVESSPDRLESHKDLVADLGGEFKDFYLTMGQYDGIAIAAFPDDETAAEYALILGKAGNVRTETLRAFSDDEFESIVTDLS
ncbi:GYD family protein [Halorhabdus utahensis DSM 12940]|uniref:GYD family protein n=1 Tax=Halorhabdus utahensis (strain DSM 12940 / JCM 11049 / AX-2) TaxID=519442 RepID=C7NUL1_HALUD|nr:GYD domain-containing protein [Halorhabdus utahensis]ACV12368.1 GYD family protein [Halorhabdus utahensis DSM 12940]